MLRTRTVLLGLAATGLLAGALTACGGSAHPSAAPSTSATADSAVTALQQRAHLAAGLSFSGTYGVASATASGAVVRVWVTPTAYRVEVAEGDVTAALYGSSTIGTVACPEQAGQPTLCFTVAAAGQPVPAAFDAGIERVFTRDLPALATGASVFRVTSTPAPADVTAKVAGTECWQVARKAGSPPITTALVQLVDEGTYCLGPTGVPTQLGFASGALTVLGLAGPPTAADLALPAAPQPLPAAATASPSASPTSSFPQLFGSAAAPTSTPASTPATTPAP